jgi:hypothetical protein
MSLMTVLGMLFLSQARFRADAPHLLPAFLAAAPLFSCLLFCVHRRKKALALIPVGLAVLFFMTPGIATKIKRVSNPAPPTVLDLPGAEKIDVAPRDAAEAGEFSNYAKTVRYVRQIAAPGEKIFVGSTRHDRVCYADPLFYVLSGHDSATRYHEMHRGRVTTEAVQKEIAGELEKGPVRVVVLRKLLDDQCGEPNASSRPDGSKFLDEYIQTHYTPDRRFGGNFVYLRRPPFYVKSS